MPLWSRIRRINKAIHAFKGVNASVIGLLIAAFYDPIITSSLRSLEDMVLVIIALVILFLTKISQWLAVFILSMCGWGISFL